MVAPPAILWANERLKKHPQRPPSYRFAGSQGDVNHGYGYHITENQHEAQGSPYDYSFDLSIDKKGGHKYPNYASAWDLSFNARDMKLVTKRFVVAAKNHDPRLYGSREGCGTLNGRQTYPWQVHPTNESEGVDSWDPSHLSHFHASFMRWYCNDKWAMYGFIEIICGVPLSKTKVPRFQAKPIKKPIRNPPPNTSVPKPPQHRPSPIPKFPYGPLGRINERKNNKGKYVLAIQKQLQKDGAAPKTKGWADGVWEKETTAAYHKWLHMHGLKRVDSIGPGNWKRLFNPKFK